MKLKKYQEIESYLLEELSGGKYAVGDRFPSETELAIQFNVNALTIRKAYTKLVENGYVVRKRRTGTFVSALPEKPVKFRVFKYCLIGVVLGRNIISDIKIARIMLALQQAIERHGYMTVVVHDNYEALFEAGIIGAISVAEITPECREMFKKNNVQLVEFGSTSPGKFHIKPDFEMAADFAIKIFADAARKNILVAGNGKEAVNTYNNIYKYMKKYAANYLMSLGSCVFEDKAQFFSHLNNDFSRYDAIFVLNSWCLDSIAAVLAEKGKTAGKDISVLVHGSNALLIPASPPWAILDIDVEQAANTLVDCLHELILNSNAEIEMPLSPYLPVQNRGSV